MDTLDFLKNRRYKKVGNTYTFGETKLGVSRDKAKEFLANNEEIYQKIREEINKLIKNKYGNKKEIFDEMLDSTVRESIANIIVDLYEMRASTLPRPLSNKTEK